MYCYRITKYDPIHRSESGAYQKNEWTSFSDIGNTFDGVILTPEKYLCTEDAYVETISLFMDCLNVDSLIIRNLEKHNAPKKDHFYSPEMVKVYNAIENNKIVDKQTILMVARLCLRENMWCRLEADRMFVHFGYDYYMYVGSKNQPKNVIRKIEKLELFVEEIEFSPHSR